MLLEQPAPEESKDESPLSQRMDLRGSASTLADPAIEFISRIFKEQGFNKNIQFDIEYDSIDFVAEATIGLNTISENLPMPSGEYFDVLGEVDFVIQGLYDPASSIFDLDAGYIHAGDEEL